MRTHLDPLESERAELYQRFIVIARNHHHPRAGPSQFEESPDDREVVAPPRGVAAQAPQIDDVAHEVKCLRPMTLEEGEHAPRVAAVGPQMQVGDQHRAEMLCGSLVAHPAPPRRN